MADVTSSSNRPQRSLFRAPRSLFWTALAVRVLVIVIGHTYRVRVRDDFWEFGYEAGRIARSVATGHGYANPFNGVSGPTAWLGPLFPLLMALGFKLFGVYTRAAVIVVMVVDSVFSAGTAVAVYEIGARCFDAYGLARRAAKKAVPVALWSGWIWALYPAFIQYPVHWLWEMSISGWLFAWALVFALRLRRVGEDQCLPTSQTRDTGHPAVEEPRAAARRDWLLWAGFGALWGLQTLSNASLMICLPAVLLWVVWPSLFGRSSANAGATQQPRARMLGGAVLCCVLVVAAMTPWTLRNERALHAFVPSRSNFGVEMWNATLWYHDALPWGSAVPLSPTDPEFQLFARMGEVKYAKMRQHEAFANIKADPGEYAKFTALRVQYFWFIWRHPSDAKPAAEMIRLWNYGFWSAAGLLGLALALKRRVPGAWMMFWVALLLPIPYYLVTVQARFRYPMEPLLCVLAVYLFRSAEPLRNRMKKVKA